MYQPGILDDRGPAGPTTDAPLPPWQPPAAGFSPVPPPSPAPRRTGRVAGAIATVLLAAGAYAGWQLVRAEVSDTGEEIADAVTEQVLGTDAGGDVFSLTLGQCLDELPATGTVTEVPTVPCTEPHVYEVYSVFDLPATPYPGDATIATLASAGCDAAFLGFTGVGYAQSVLVHGYLTPTQESWAAGDHAVVCLVTDPTVPTTTGSLAGARR
ncbi:septum formation family protein [Blastococcus sp. SYSU D00669]